MNILLFYLALFKIISCCLAFPLLLPIAFPDHPPFSPVSCPSRHDSQSFFWLTYPAFSVVSQEAHKLQPWLLGEWEGIQKAILLVYYTLYTPSGPVKLSYSNNVCMYLYGNTCYLVRLALGKVIVLCFLSKTHYCHSASLHSVLAVYICPLRRLPPWIKFWW